MQLLGVDGRSETIKSLKVSHGAVAVYNFAVEGEHDYFVGRIPVLVHNQAPVNTDFNKATNTALTWLRQNGVDTSKVEGPYNAKFGPHKGSPIGVKFEGGGYYRIEFDNKSGAHINVGKGKLKGPHIQFEGNEKTVNKLIGRLFKC